MNVLVAISLLVLQAPLIGSAKDGVLSVRDAGVTVNRHTLLTKDAPAQSTSLEVSDATAIVSNGLILLHQTQLSVEKTGSANQGTLVSDELGRSELAVVKSVEGTRIFLAQPLTHGFFAEGAQVVTVPEYGEVLVTSTGELAASFWSPDAGGGILVFLARTLTIEDGGALSARARGFPGGAADVDVSARPKIAPCAGGGTYDAGSRQLYVSSRSGTGVNTGYEGARGRQHGWMSAPGHVAPPPELQTCHRDGGVRPPISFDLGGAGGGHLGNGGWPAVFIDKSELPEEVQALGAFRSLGGRPTTSLRPAFGGGGAAGTGDLGTTAVAQRPGRGGNGGGIVLIRAGTIWGGGLVTVQGEPGEEGVADGPGGGGAGGTIDTLTAQVGTCPAFDARGGQGGSNTVAGIPTAPGGGGGGGLVLLTGGVNDCDARVDGGPRGWPLPDDSQWLVATSRPGRIERLPTTLADDVPLTVDYPLEGHSYLAETMCLNGSSEAGAVIQGEIDGVELEPAWVEEKRFVLCGAPLRAGRHEARVWARSHEGVRLSPPVTKAFITTPPRFSCGASGGWAAPWLLAFLPWRRRK